MTDMRRRPLAPSRRRSRQRHDRLIAAACLLALIACSGTASRPSSSDGEALGTVDFPVSCSPEAQASFNRGVALLHHMTYPKARAAFEETATLDPQCAMAPWGVAMTLFQPLWPTRPSPAALREGWAAIERAKALQPLTERERLFVATGEAFFLDPDSTDYWRRIQRWAQAAERVYRTYPDDVEASAFHALALLATAPPSDSGARVHADSASAILLTVYANHPEHPGAMHYLVHANDVNGREHESLEITEKYDASAPENPHALHMPTHIYTRLGDWDAVVSGNLRAAAAALKSPAGDKGQYVWDEFPHAIEYLVYAYLQQGADDSAAAEVARLRETRNLEPSFKTAFHLASTQARYALERRDWAAAARVVPREGDGITWGSFTWPEAITSFARGLGTTHTGQRAEASAMAARLDTLERATRAKGEALFSSNIRVLRLALDAWIAQDLGRPDSALTLMQLAVVLERATPKHAVTPAPTLPAPEQLGDLLMQQGRSADALAAYRESLALYPRRFNSVLGAARASKAVGESATASQYYQELLQIAARGTRQAPLDEAHDFLAARP